MGYSKIQLECLDCGDIIESIYDSRINMKNNRSVCKCGKLDFTAESHGNFSYERGAKYRKIDKDYYKTLDDYFIVTDKIKIEINKVREYLNNLKNKYSEFDFTDYDWYDNVEDEKILYCQEFSFIYYYPGYIESNQFELDLSFYKFNSYDKDEKIELNMLERLNKFYSFLEMINNNLDIIKDRKYLWDECDLTIDGNKKQLELYDYEFAF